MDWTDYPNLFANGKFKIYWQGVHKIETWHPTTNVFTLLPVDFTAKVHVKVKDCQLIARKIEDMTDGEVNNVPIFENWKADYTVKLNNLIWRVEKDAMWAEDFLYLLSIEVFPFEWPESGVIDKKTLTCEA